MRSGNETEGLELHAGQGHRPGPAVYRAADRPVDREPPIDCRRRHGPSCEGRATAHRVRDRRKRVRHGSDAARLRRKTPEAGLSMHVRPRQPLRSQRRAGAGGDVRCRPAGVEHAASGPAGGSDGSPGAIHPLRKTDGRHPRERCAVPGRLGTTGACDLVSVRSGGAGVPLPRIRCSVAQHRLRRADRRRSGGPSDPSRDQPG